jgi:hypothetical protein
MKLAAQCIVSFFFGVLVFCLFALPAVAGVIVGIEVWLYLGGLLGIILGMTACAIIEIGAYFGFGLLFISLGVRR